MTTQTSAAIEDFRSRLQAILGEAYRIERELTAGGMSRLYLATETALDRTVVVKLLPPEMVSEQSLARFRREVDITAHLQHPHVLPVLGAGARDGLLYYIMPFVSGESMRHRLDAGDPLPLIEGLRLLREVADALAYAHSRNVIHRDIKPENILIEEGHAVLADFGIARAVFGSGANGTRLTSTGLSIGTLGYMPPEQLFGEHTIDLRADVYALGIVAYEVLSGAPPFVAATPQAVVAAHLTEAPKPLVEVNPQVPLPVSEAIARALAKTPDERLQSAAELRDAFEAGLSLLQTRSFGVATGAIPTVAAPPRRRWLPWAVAAAAVVAAVGSVLVRARPGAGLDRTLVAIAPFQVEGRELQLWREGMVDVLARNLDGAGPLRTVAPALAIGKWSGSGNESDVATLARETGAGLVVLGTLASRGDTVVATARLVDARRGRASQGITLRGSAADVGRLAEQTTVELLRAIGTFGGVKGITAPRTGLGATSIKALKLFLQGEQRYRRLAWDSAQTLYEQAIAADAGFALALRRAGLAIAWQKSSQDSASLAYLLRAGAHNRQLAPRDSLLVTADSLRASLNAFGADSTWLPRARRLFATLDAAVTLYPTDPEAWFALADARYHYAYGAGVGVVDREIFANLDRSIALDSTFAPAYPHAIEIALALDSAAAAREYARTYLRLEPGGSEAHGIRLVARVLDLAEARSAAIATVLDSVSTAALYNAWLMLRRWPDDAETSVRVIQALYDRRLRDVTFTDTASARLYLALQKSYRGHVREAAELLGGQPSRTRVELAMLHGLAPDSADAEMRRWVAAGDPRILRALPAWFARRGDTASIAVVRRRAEALAASSTDAWMRREARYVVTSAQAYAALARGDTATALARFAALPDSVCMGCYVDRFDRARLLHAHRDDRTAALLLDERPFNLLTPMEIPEALERARVAERLGDLPKARDAYRVVARTWAGADSLLRPAVTEARQRLAKLAPESR